MSIANLTVEDLCARTGDSAPSLNPIIKRSYFTLFLKEYF